MKVMCKAPIVLECFRIVSDCDQYPRVCNGIPEGSDRVLRAI
nr:MAG TPA: hypothetical protein [Caudoviricetes sp.]